jgi:uncharacterized protein (DUF2147 family)
MKKLFVLAALLMATTSAHAGGISFEIEGQRVRIEAPRNCSSLSCLSITAPGFKGLKSKRFDDDDDMADRDDRRDDRNYRDDRASRDDRNDRPYRDDAPRSKYAPAPAPVQATAPQAVTPAAAPAAPAADSTTVASTAPVQSDVAAPAPAPAPQPAPVAAAPVSDPNSPLGVWATEENKGNVSIEQCGDNLCGYAVKTGEKILISMKPTGSKWAGRIHDPDSGRNYDSTMAMKGTNTLRVQGCAFGGMFCGGQTWKRVS